MWMKVKERAPTRGKFYQVWWPGMKEKVAIGRISHRQNNTWTLYGDPPYSQREVTHFAEIPFLEPPVAISKVDCCITCKSYNVSSTKHRCGANEQWVHTYNICELYEAQEDGPNVKTFRD